MLANGICILFYLLANSLLFHFLGPVARFGQFLTVEILVIFIAVVSFLVRYTSPYPGTVAGLAEFLNAVLAGAIVFTFGFFLGIIYEYSLAAQLTSVASLVVVYADIIIVPRRRGS
ncbi:MAG: hypothetical protein HYT12_03105 [Candidatus Liptonbacteria bacterium]|nr:hypothetical protein [Candidatus Liptonbacteria bacterium]